MNLITTTVITVMKKITDEEVSQLTEKLGKPTQKNESVNKQPDVVTIDTTLEFIDGTVLLMKTITTVEGSTFEYYLL